MTPVRCCLRILGVLLILPVCACSRPAGERPRDAGAPAVQKMLSINLPKTAGAWTRPDAPRRIDETSIFSYMDGGGELYLGYRFDHLDVYEEHPRSVACV